MLSMKDHKVKNIFSFEGHKVSLTTAKLCPVAWKQPWTMVNENVWVCYNRPSFMGTEIQISYNIQVSQNVIIP